MVPRILEDGMQFNLRLKERKNVLNTALLLPYKMMPANLINM